jgi:uncharacterized protein YjbJ (UPF0337 family)
MNKDPVKGRIEQAKGKAESYLSGTKDNAKDASKKIIDSI